MNVRINKLFSSNSFEVPYSELSPYKAETKNFAVSWACSSIGFFLISIIAIIGVFRADIYEADRIGILCLTVLPIVLMFASILAFWNRTYDFVLFKYKTDGFPVVYIYRNCPNDQEVDQFVGEVKKRIEGKDKTGFIT